MVWESFVKLQAGCHVHFTLELIPSSQYNNRTVLWSSAEMVVLLKGSPISTEELWSFVRVTIGFLVMSLTKALLPRLLSLPSEFGRSKLHSFKNDGSHCILGDLQRCRNVLVPFHRSVHRHNPVLECNGQLFNLMACSLLWRALPTVGPCRHVCAFPNHVQSIVFTTGGL